MIGAIPPYVVIHEHLSGDALAPYLGREVLVRNERCDFFMRGTVIQDQDDLRYEIKVSDITGGFYTAGGMVDVGAPLRCMEGDRVIPVDPITITLEGPDDCLSVYEGRRTRLDDPDGNTYEGVLRVAGAASGFFLDTEDGNALMFLADDRLTIS